MFTEVLHPRSLDARVVGGGFHLIHEVRDVRVESFLELLVGDASLAGEAFVRLREREHDLILARISRPLVGEEDLDVEVLFLLPFAVAFTGLSAGALIAMLLFILLLAEGLVWAWHRGHLEWK